MTGIVAVVGNDSTSQGIYEMHLEDFDAELEVYGTVGDLVGRLAGGVTPSLIITGNALPNGMDGLDLLACVRESQYTGPVCLATSDEVSQDEMLRAGFARVIPKGNEAFFGLVEQTFKHYLPKAPNT